MNSVWSESVSFENYPALQKDISVDTVVIGGGMAGLLTAYKLQKQGKEVVVIEADRVCSGQTKNTTAKITSQHGDIYHKIEKFYGAQASRHYAQANEKAISDYQHIINEKGIDCDFEIKKAVLYTTTDSKTIDKEYKSAKKAGIDCFLTRICNLPFTVLNAVAFNNQAQFNPLKFAKAILNDLTVYENTPAIRIVGNTVYTKQAKISANNIVVATHYPFVNFPSAYFLKISQERSYVVAFEKGNRYFDDMYIGIEDDTLSFRAYKDYILLGGGAHRTGVNDVGDAFSMLWKKADEYYNSPQKAFCWSAQDCVTLDEIPYIGRFNKSSSNIYVATGFGKWGMTSSMVSANIICDMICGVENEYCDIFSPQRFNLLAGAKNFADNTAQTLKGFATHLCFAIENLQDVQKGEAKEIRFNGHTAGAFRDNDGKVYVVSLKCPHLKCKLQFNSTTKTWDCPCHGSRYDYKGNLLDNPSQAHSILIAIKD